MITNFSDIALLVLAAGQARRFGSQKLLALVAGRPIVHATVANYSEFPFCDRIAVVADLDFGLDRMGFTVVRSQQLEAPLSSSLAEGIALIKRTNALAVMIALGDMPFVTPSHIARLVYAFDGDRIGSIAGGITSPPAIFGRIHFGLLESLKGDRGAANLLRDAPTVETGQAQLRDIDVPDDLKPSRL